MARAGSMGDTASSLLPSDGAKKELKEEERATEEPPVEADEYERERRSGPERDPEMHTGKERRDLNGIGSHPADDMGEQDAGELDREEQAVEEPELEAGYSDTSSIREQQEQAEREKRDRNRRQRRRPQLLRSATSAKERRNLLALELATYALLALATIWGVLARLGLNWIGSFASDAVFAPIWAQVVGCFLMGLATVRKPDFEQLYPPLFTAFTTGLCGSMTTFSTFVYDVFLAFANVSTPERPRFGAFMNGFAQTVITFALSIAALKLGLALGRHLPPLPRRKRVVALHRHMSVHATAVALGLLTWVAAALLAGLGPRVWRGRATFAITFGPAGTLLRFHLSRMLNSRQPRFPLGTFAANIFASLVIAACGAVQRGAGLDVVQCAVVQGISDGFCGSLSTVSTFALELRNLAKRRPRRDAYIYAGVSWAAGVLACVVVFGSWWWSQGQYGSYPLCSA